MADIAKHAQVSAMTVSRALKNDGRVSEDTRARIAEVAEELGYLTNDTARSLASRKTGFIGAVIPSINNSNFSDTARGITDTLTQAGLQLLLGYTDYSIEREEALVRSMLRRRPEGIILTGGEHSKTTRKLLIAAGVPVVETWDLAADPIDCVVGFSNSDALGLLVKTMAARGYRRFAYLGGEKEDTRGRQRREGFLTALGELGLSSHRLSAHGAPPVSLPHGAHAFAAMMEAWPDTEIAICVSDLPAFGALHEAHRRGLRIPDDIAIAGFGDFEIGMWSYPTLTTVSVDCYNIGKLAAESLLKAIRKPNEDKAGYRRIVTPYSVIERDSTRSSFISR